MRRGLLLVVSGPSGVGKGTICQALRNHLPNLEYSISATTRLPRPGEQDGREYLFHQRGEFEARIERDEFLEWAEVYGNYYGTPRRYVEETLAQGKDILLEIDMQGALQVKKRFPEGVFVFLLPPSLEEQRRRIQKRGTENVQDQLARLEAAVAELQHLPQYDYVVVNDQLEQGVCQLESIIVAEGCRVGRNQELLAQLLRE